MRVDQNQGAQAPESERTGRQSAAGGGGNRASASGASGTGGAFGEDQAQLSGAHAQVQALAAQAGQFPEIRQEKMSALRQAVLGGNYQPGSKQVAEALFDHMAVKPAA